MTSETSHASHDQVWPHERHERCGDQPRRLSSTIAFSPRAATSRRAADVVGVKRPLARVRLAHVEDVDPRHRAAVDALGQLEALEVEPALGARSRGAADEHRARVVGAAAGDLARVVARVGLLLVAGVVLLVDDDEPEVAHGGEDRRARPDADQRVAAAQPPPLVVALPRPEPRVKQRDGVAEALAKAGDRLRRQRDLGDEHDRAAAALAAPRRRRRGRPRSCRSR